MWQLKEPINEEKKDSVAHSINQIKSLTVSRSNIEIRNSVIHQNFNKNQFINCIQAQQLKQKSNLQQQQNEPQIQGRSQHMLNCQFQKIDNVIGDNDSQPEELDISQGIIMERSIIISENESSDPSNTIQRVPSDFFNLAWNQSISVTNAQQNLRRRLDYNNINDDVSIPDILSRQYSTLFIHNIYGAPQQLIERLPQRKIDLNFVKKFDETQEDYYGKCIICFEHYIEDDVIRTMPCMHYFHKDCLDKWLQQKNSCPICKTSCDAEYLPFQ